MVCGPVASGKTTFVRNTFPDALVVSCDNYFLDRSDTPESMRAHLNYDEPSALDASRLCEDVQKLMARYPVDMPVYDFVTHTVTGSTRVVPDVSTTTLVVEGHLAGILLRGLFERRPEETRWMPRWTECIYLDVDDATCLSRRLRRDSVRGWTDAQIIEQHTVFTRPARVAYVEPQMSFATRVVTTDDKKSARK